MMKKITKVLIANRGEIAVPFLRILMQQRDFAAATTNVRWVEEFISRSPPGIDDDRSPAGETVG